MPTAINIIAKAFRSQTVFNTVEDAEDNPCISVPNPSEHQDIPRHSPENGRPIDSPSGKDVNQAWEIIINKPNPDTLNGLLKRICLDKSIPS